MARAYVSTERLQTSKRALALLFHAAVYGGFAWAFGVPGWPLSGLAVGLAGVLIWISVVDIQRFEIPDMAAAVLFLGGAGYVAFRPGVYVPEHLLGAVFWPLLFLAVGTLYLRHRGLHGLGFGDVKLIAGLALWVGFQGAGLVVLAASLAGMATLLVFAMLGRGQEVPIGKSAVAFGPFLCLSAWVVWLQGVGG